MTTQDQRPQTPRPLPHLDTFAIAADLGSFTATARTMGVTQAAISQRIAALETELDTQVFDRIKGRIVLNGAGERLRAIVTKVHALHDRARQVVKEQPVSTLETP
jgi:DNA-binding transcriptional LysR family regulator